MRGIKSVRERMAWRHHCVQPRTGARLVEHGAVLVDVRDRRHWAAGRAPDARHIPLDELPARVGELPPDRPVIFVSCSGRRGRRAAAWLAHRGPHASNITGGMHAWQRARLPVIGQASHRCH